MCIIQYGKLQRRPLKRMEASLEDKQPYGGVIAIDRHGNLGIDFNIKEMPWASAKDGTLTKGFFQDEAEEEPIDT